MSGPTKYADRAEYPLLLSSELTMLIDSLSVLRRLVDTGAASVDEVLYCQQVADCLVSQSSIDNCSLYLRTEGRLEYMAGAGRNSASAVPNPFCFSDNEQLARRCLEADPATGPAIERLTQSDRYALAVGLRYRHQKLGCIVLNYADVERFQPWHERLFGLCADLVSQSLLTLRLVHRLRWGLDDREHKLAQMDTRLRAESRRRESAENALLAEREGRSEDESLARVTGLPNQEFFYLQLRSAVSRVREFGEPSSLLLMDIDHFKVINEVAGHAAGDRLIRMLAERVSDRLLTGCHCARLGTDEFGILLAGCEPVESMTWASALLAELNALIFESEGERFAVGTSLGMVHFQPDCPDPEELVRMAYSACQSAQEQNVEMRVFNDKDVRMRRRYDRARMLRQLIRTIDDDGIELFCQPIHKLEYDTATAGRGCRGEILVRMRDAQGRLVSGGEMLDLAERFGFSSKLDRWVLTRTLDVLTDDLLDGHSIDQLAINLSAQSIANGEFLDFLVEAVGNARIDPARLCFEITETAAILDLQAASHLIARVKALGCTFALDDFGSGYASYLYLRELAVDYLKIDGEFVRNMATDAVNQDLVRTMIDMGKILGKQIVAESVENEATLKLLRAMQVDFVQGYYLGRPQPLLECLHLVD